MTPATPRFETLSVLVLEKDSLITDDARRALQDAGARVVGPFQDAADAIAEVDRHRPSCALVDINLGAGPNFAAARALIARGIPVVFITGYDTGPIPADLEKVPRLQKPVNGHKAITAVKAVCGGT
jgi:DNA-binding NarL/FixJ family response regulator